MGLNPGISSPKSYKTSPWLARNRHQAPRTMRHAYVSGALGSSCLHLCIRSLCV